MQIKHPPVKPSPFRLILRFLLLSFVYNPEGKDLVRNIEHP
jgi:hypothetical protein